MQIKKFLYNEVLHNQASSLLIMIAPKFLWCGMLCNEESRKTYMSILGKYFVQQKQFACTCSGFLSSEWSYMIDKRALCSLFTIFLYVWVSTGFPLYYNLEIKSQKSHFKQIRQLNFGCHIHFINKVLYLQDINFLTKLVQTFLNADSRTLHQLGLKRNPWGALYQAVVPHSPVLRHCPWEIALQPLEWISLLRLPPWCMAPWLRLQLPVTD